MNCHEVSENIWEYLDGDLPEELGHSLDMHLEICRECRNRLALEKALGSWLPRAAQSRLERFLRTGPVAVRKRSPFRLGAVLKPIPLVSLFLATMLLNMAFPLWQGNGGGCRLTSNFAPDDRMARVIAIEDTLDTINEVIVRSRFDGQVAEVRINIEIQQ